MKGIIVQGSSRSDGNTARVINHFNKGLDYSIIDLKTKNIGYYDYAHSNINDDFIDVMKTIVEDHDTLIIATPVYWYSMSGIVKVFLDRITDCLKVEKQIGRQLRGMNMAVLACGSDNVENVGFFEPFKNSAEYLGMKYIEGLHTWIDGSDTTEEVLSSIDSFSKLFHA